MLQPTRSLAAAFLLATSAVLLAGCPSKPKYPECKTDPDCAEQKQVCVNGTCKECRDNAQCKEGFVCKDNACVPKPQCAENKDCPSGQKCAEGKCVAECSENKDCGEGKKCLAGRCAEQEACNADGDCEGGKSCVNGRCGIKQVKCGGDDDCPADAACVGGVCQSGAARRVKCDLKPVHFAFDKAALTGGERGSLDKVAECLKKHRAKKIKVEGHCDERGTTEYNLALGSRRANAVKNYLGKLVDGLDIQTESFGEERPVDKGHGEAAWSKNRRAEIVTE